MADTIQREDAACANYLAGIADCKGECRGPITTSPPLGTRRQPLSKGIHTDSGRSPRHTNYLTKSVDPRGIERNVA